VKKWGPLYWHRDNSSTATPDTELRLKRAAAQAHNVDISAHGIRVDGALLPELTVEAFKNAFGDPRIMEPASKEPDDRGCVPSTLVIWDASGVMVYTNDGRVVEEFQLRLAEDPVWENSVNFDFATWRPRCVFSGEFTVDGKQPLDAIPVKTRRRAYYYCEIWTGCWKSTLYLTGATSIDSMGFLARMCKSEIRAIQFREASVNCKPPRMWMGK